MSNVPLPEPDWILEVRQWLQDRDNAHAAAVSAADNKALRERIKVLEDALRSVVAEVDADPSWASVGNAGVIARAALEQKS